MRARGRAGRPIGPSAAVAVAAALIIAAAAPAAAGAAVPFGSWIYPAIDYLKTRGLVPLWMGAARPMSRHELRAGVDEALRRARGVVLDAFDRALLERLAREVGLPSGAPVAATGSAYPQIGFSVPYAVLSGGGPDVGWMLGAQASGPLRLSAAALAFQAGPVSWLAGRAPIGWGPGVAGGLFFSEAAGGLDRIQASFEWRWLRATRAVGWLDGGRSLVATRVDITPNPALRVGLSDVVVMRGGPYWLYVVNPLSLVLDYPISLRIRGPRFGMNDNVLWAADVEWLARPGLRLYGEVLVDDYVWNPPSYPARWGLTAGADALGGVGGWDLLVQYTRVPNWTYSAVPGSSHYLLRGLPLGHPLGADFDLWHLRLTRRLDPDRSLAVWASRIRKGEGRVGQLWADRDEAFRDAFLEGVVERSVIAGVERSWRREAWSYAVGPWLALRANAGHVQGITRLDWGVSLAISGRF